ncbi:GEVED domain-containing protein [Chryseobacterium viscerum]|uniref:T9SS C-terminal target domain-containing protein n=1 Tax=Chryseobacterium viscerum TaxID=1037377 RepID=A0A316WKH1_9FLAO|nr:GEVED domain-containing protein [Chryseobacterium viscerum]PWN61669.1 T9SS C-terminal target domain-containing protein [Chryseobacterium viscerum]
MAINLFSRVIPAIALFSASVMMAQNYQTMPVASGFTADVIANGIGSSTITTNNDVDGVSYAFVAKDFQLTSTSAAISYGIPIDGIINSVIATTPGLSFQLASLNANNSLRLAAVNDAGTLAFTTPKAVIKLYMLAVSGSGTSTINVVVNFTDGSSQTFSGISLPDWYGGTNFAVQGIGRIKKPGAIPASGDDVPSPEGGTNPRLYQNELAIDAANQAKPIQSVTVTKVSGSGLPNVFAFSADAYSDCAPPVLQAVSGVTANSALVSWTAPSSAASYDVYHSTSSTIPASTVTPTYPAVSGTSKTIGSLNSNTTYYYWVRTNCSSATSQSAWSFAGTFKTACSTFTVPYTENFDTTSVGSSTNTNAPSCWAYLESASFTGYGYVTTTNNYSAPNAYYLYNSTASTGSQMLVSPPTINLSDGTKRVRFYARTGTAGTTLLMGTLSNPADPASFTQIGSPIALTTTHTQYTVNIPAGSDLQLAFKHGLGGSNRAIYIDNITVQNIPSCLEPTAVTTPNVTMNSAVIGWTAPASTPANGYEVYYSTTNTAPDATTVLNASNSATSATTSAPLNSLSADTNYYAWVRSSCSATDKSIWSDVIAFRTGYCQPSSSGQASWLSAFNSTGALIDMTYASGSSVAGGYQNLTTTNNRITNAPGSSTNISFTAGGPTCGIAVWVDWNNNLTFETSERMFVTSNYVTTTTGSITAPAGTPVGNYRMRVVTDYNSTAPASPCTAISRGEFIDFVFEVATSLSTLETGAKKKEISVYPNPFKDVLHIADIKDVKSVTITDVAGRVVKTIDQPTNELQLGELNAGLYLVTMNFKDGSKSTVKAIKK